MGNWLMIAIGKQKVEGLFFPIILDSQPSLKNLDQHASPFQVTM